MATKSKSKSKKKQNAPEPSDLFDVYVGEDGLGQSWQAPFPKTTACVHCSQEARIGFVAVEGMDRTSSERQARHREVRIGFSVCHLHPNDPDGEGFWLVDFQKMFCQKEKQNTIIVRLDAPAEVIRDLRNFGKQLFEEATRYDMVHHGLFGRIWTADVYLDNNIDAGRRPLAAGDRVSAKESNRLAIRIYLARVPASPRTWYESDMMTMENLERPDGIFRAGDAVRVLGKEAWDKCGFPSCVDGPHGWNDVRKAAVGLAFMVKGQDGSNVSLVGHEYLWPAACLKSVGTGA